MIIQKNKNGTEEDLKIGVLLKFEEFFKKFDISLNELCTYEQNHTGNLKLKGPTDVLSGTLIIEFKRYGFLSSSTNYEKTVTQVREKYLIPLKENQSHYHSIIFDGVDIVFLEFEKNWTAIKKPFNRYTLYDWILIISRKLKIPISSQTLLNSFSINSNLAISTIHTFYQSLIVNLKKNGRTKMLFEEWKKSFSYIYGGVLNEQKIKNDFQEIANLISNTSKVQVEPFLFCFYTYYALIIKIYASEIIVNHLPIAPESTVNSLLHSKKLKEALHTIESGEFFKDSASIDNYIEGGFFAWYLDSWNNEIENTLKNILNESNKFNFSISINENESRDILKNLYQKIIPSKIRHDLGEYYTPDWLIDSVLDDVKFDGDSTKKILDAGCGSGGFIVEILNRIKNKNRDKDPKELLTNMISNVVGFDVNPVAVLTARTNYLLAISTLIKQKHTPFPITLPIYLADSIITPTKEGKGKIKGNSYFISTVEGVFSLPKNFVDSGFLTEGMQIIENCLESDYPTDDFLKLFSKTIPLEKNDLSEIGVFFEMIKKLHILDKNRIWVKIIQNSFAPILHTQFDYIVGNPPWIKWEFLSKEYKKRLSYLYLKIYKLFSHTGMKAGLGYSHDDISSVFLYVAADKYLKNDGILGFVMKQTLYKSVAGNEFRKFQIEKENNENIPLKVLKVNDMLKLQPFRRSANAETSTIIMKKGSSTEYPIPYHIWLPNKTTIKENDTWHIVKKKSTVIKKNAFPKDVNNPTDTWIILDSKQIPQTQINTTNYYIPRHGIVNDLNGVFFVNILQKNDKFVQIENNAVFNKMKVKTLKKIIETDLIYPVLKPKHIKKWKINGYNYCILPQRKAGEKNISELRISHPKTFNYLSVFKKNLLNRSSRWFKGNNVPFYSIFGIGDYSFQTYKIVWSCMSYLPNFVVVSSVNDKNIGKKMVMPDNTIGSISTNNKKEAHFICALLNSKFVESILEPQSTKSKWGISIGMIKNIPIPKFDSTNQYHSDISSLSIDAHTNPLNIDTIEKKINILSELILGKNN